MLKKRRRKKKEREKEKKRKRKRKKQGYKNYEEYIYEVCIKKK